MIVFMYSLAIAAVFLTLLPYCIGNREQRAPLHTAYSVLCLAAVAYMAFTAQLLSAESLSRAAFVLRMQTTSLLVFVAALVVMGSQLANTGRWRGAVGAWLGFGAILAAINFIQPFGLFYSDLQFTHADSSPFGDWVNYFDGTASVWALGGHLYVQLSVLWFFYCTYRSGLSPLSLIFSMYLLGQSFALTAGMALLNQFDHNLYMIWVPLLWLFGSYMLHAASQRLDLDKEMERRILVEQELRTGLMVDELTGLPNHQGLIAQLEALKEGEVNGHALLFLICVSNFKAMNAIYGYAGGDRILQKVARRLSENTEPGMFVARTSGVCFVVLLPGKEELLLQESFDGKKWRDGADLLSPLHYNGQKVHLEYNVGVVQFDYAECEPREQLSRAALALDEARKPATPTVVLYNQDLAAQVARDKLVETELARAVENGELYLHFQPKVDAAAECIGAEVLMRWSHPTLGEISPAEFIPVAEASGQMPRLGRWLFDETFRRVSEWRREGFEMRGRLALNISSVQICESSFAENFLSLIARSQIPTSMIEVELTESGMVANPDLASEQLSMLREAGVAVAIDDFGTGYSTLSYLGKLPIDVLKIDKSFVDNLNTRKGSQLVHAMIDIGAAMQMSVVAEGVETREQQDALKAMGCSMFQGYFYSRPLSELSFRDWSDAGLFAAG